MKCERTRRTQPAIKVRPFPEERAVLEECAAAARMPLAGFLLAAGLGTTVKSVVDLQHVATLAKAHADMGRLGGLLKLWLSREGTAGLDHPTKAEIRNLLHRIDEAQNTIKTAAERVVKRF